MPAFRLVGPGAGIGRDRVQHPQVGGRDCPELQAIGRYLGEVGHGVRVTRCWAVLSLVGAGAARASQSDGVLPDWGAMPSRVPRLVGMVRRAPVAALVLVLTMGVPFAAPAGANPAGGLVAVRMPSVVKARASGASCLPAVRAVYARSLPPTVIRARESQSLGLVTCRFRATKAGAGRCGGVTVMLNTAPHAYQDFQRWLVETGQTAAQSSIRRPGAFPVEVRGVGLEADWVPGGLLFEAATPRRWVTVTLNCAIPSGRGLSLARALAQAAISAPAGGAVHAAASSRIG